MLNKNTEILLHLSLAEHVGPATVFKILHKLFLGQNPNLLDPDWSDIAKNGINLDLRVIYDFSTFDFINKFGLSQSYAQQIYDCVSDSRVLEEELALAEKNNVKIVDILSSEYPEILRQIHFPPIVLYFSGGMFDQQAKHFGVVGARNSDEYGFHAIQSIVPTLISNGWVIVSGGANGADTMAHQITLNSGGKTVVVFGSGLLRPYPENNINLFKAVVDSGGSVISPFPLNRRPDKGTFPARNRIISGLSSGCLVVQAAIKSGALITARCALEQGRLVFAIPGKIDDNLSAGCNELLKQGAKLVCHSNDILEEFGECLPQGLFKPSVSIDRQMKIVENNCDQCNDIVLCCLDKSQTFDELMVKTGLDFAELQDKLFGFQLEGKVKQNFTGAWERT
jgi:DNA processing protein